MVIVAASIKALRPKQWAKNVLLLAPLVFSSAFLTSPSSLVSAIVAVASFSLLASAGYILNDYLDREADRQHPKKQHRPIASGALPEGLALIEMVAILAAGVGLAWWISWEFLLIGLVYLAGTMFYSWVLKHVVILDVMVLASFYLIRVMAGAIAIQVQMSAWLFLCTAFLALFLGFHKRRAELVHRGDQSSSRKSLRRYNVRMLDQYLGIATTGVVLSYALYTVQGAATSWMTLTIPLVLFGVFRYIWLVEHRGEGEAPDETLIRDVPILLTGMLYGAMAVAILYAHANQWLPELFLR